MRDELDGSTCFLLENALGSMIDFSYLCGDYKKGFVVSLQHQFVMKVAYRNPWTAIAVDDLDAAKLKI
jgi:hypothetical protein